MKVFISHSSSNIEVAEKICAAIDNSGHSTFFAPRDIRSGFEYAEEIINGIDNSDVMLLVLSAESNTSPHVLREIERAVSRKIPVVVYKLEEVELTKSMEYFLMSHQWLTAKQGGDYGEIVDCINRFSDKSAEDAYLSAPIASKSENDSEHGRKVSILVIALCAGLIVGLLAVAVYFLADRDGNKDVDESTTTTTQSSAQISTTTTTATNNSETTTSTTTSETTPDTTTTTEDAPSVNPDALAELGDTIILGEYYDEPIEWRVIKLSDDGKQAVVVANNILTFKAFDAAESGKYNYYGTKDYWSAGDLSEYSFLIQARVRGNNDWGASNIRTWLNSDKEYVRYTDKPPKQSAMSELKNGYDTEAGFLYGFSDKEISAIVMTEISTNGIKTEDKVFLLSKDELDWIYDAGIKFAAVPTEKAIENDESGWYNTYSIDLGVDDHYWWLRDNDGTTGYSAYLVSNSYSDFKILNKSVGLEGFGIRPAMTIDLTNEIVKESLQ